MVINDGIVNILRPTGNVLFEKITIQEGVDGYVKLLPIEIIKSLSVSHVPMVLASIGSNRYYSSGTFREISGLGNILAIQAVIGHSIDPPSSPSISHAIECLSSVEFETLIAKIFEESGCFVPAYRGGTMAGADLFAHNKSDSRISIGRLFIEPGSSMSIQVKLKVHAKPLPSGIDLIIAVDAKETPNSLGSKWLQSALKDSPNTARWLRSSIDWLPEKYFEALRKTFYA